MAIKLSLNKTLYSYDGQLEAYVTDTTVVKVQIYTDYNLSDSVLVYQQGDVKDSVAIINNVAEIPGMNIRSGQLSVAVLYDNTLSNFVQIYVTKAAALSQNLVDDDPYFTVDRNKRLISVPSTQDMFAVNFDENSEIITFKFPRYADGVDLSTKEIYVNYERSDKTRNKALCTLTDTSDSYVVFTWVVSAYATQVEGTLNFNIEFRSVDYRWQTQPTSLLVYRSLLYTGEDLPDQPELLDQYLAMFAELNSHPPIPGDDGYWKIWSLDTHSYETSEFLLPKGPKGDPGKAPFIGSSGNWYEWDDASGAYTDTGKPSRGEKGNTGAEGADGADGRDGITPTIGENGNWYLGETDTGKPSRGADGATGATGQKGADGKSAYQYAVEGGYTGTEEEFSEKLASVALIVHVTGVDYNLSADKTYADIMDAILAGTTVFVDRGEVYLPLVSINTEYQSLLFGTTTCVNADTGKWVYELLIEITQNDEVKDISTLVDIPTTLPNPNALTFTGAVTGSYDGSAPLSVNIPQGGSCGSGGSVETYTGEYELIVDHTVTAEEASASSFTFTKDAYPLINGQKLLVLQISKPASVSTPWFELFAGSTTVCKVTNGTFQYSRGLSIVFYNRWLSSSATTSNKQISTYLTPSVLLIGDNDPSYGSKPYQHYTSIKLSSYMAFLEEGTVIKIYGGK